MDKLKLLAIFAHPDDESMGMGGTLAKYSAEGVETHLICASRGERGWAGEPKHNPGLKRLGEIRSKELEDAIAVLGMSSLLFLEYIDGDVEKANHVEAIKKIATHIRKIKPQVVVTFPPDGNYGPPDHIAIGQFTNAAVVCAADSTFQDYEKLKTHRVSKLYYMVDSESFVNLVESVVGEITFLVGDQMRGEVAWKEWMITTRIDAAAYCNIAWRAIQCHQSQLATLGALSEMHEDSASAILAMQGTFFRVFSLVNGGMAVERDLFEGLR